MKPAYITALLIALSLRVGAPAKACCVPFCEGCQTCEAGVCVDNDDACFGNCSMCENGTCVDDESVCTSGECEGCVDHWCGSDPSKCTGECETCVGTWCVDWESMCPGQCDLCDNGTCVDYEFLCGNCSHCQGGVCVDDPEACDGCMACVSGNCEPSNLNCNGCQSCNTNGICVDDHQRCDPGNCELCRNAFCEVCWGDPGDQCCEDDVCRDKCHLSDNTQICGGTDVGCQCAFVPSTDCMGPVLSRHYTHNVIKECTEGCGEDCEHDSWRLCYTQSMCVPAAMPITCADCLGEGEEGCHFLGDCEYNFTHLCLPCSDEEGGSSPRWEESKRCRPGST